MLSVNLLSAGMGISTNSKLLSDEHNAITGILTYDASTTAYLSFKRIKKILIP